MKALNNWFDKSARPLPWRDSPSPYAVWVSEVMLQQTQVRVVLPYFRRWMARFPTVSALAEAPLEEVLKLWEGLGYYSRARSLKKGASIIVELYGEGFPDKRHELLSIPGIGPYTAAAILSFAFHKRAVALDGNVARVLSRYFAYKEDVTKASSRCALEELGDPLLDEVEPWKSAEALIELGALICTKSSPKCGLCPLKEGCEAYKCGEPESFPKRPKRPDIIVLKRAVLVAHCKGRFLVSHNQKKGLMQGLFEFPYQEHRGNAEEIALHMAKNLGIIEAQALREQVHGFTRYRAELSPFLIEVSTQDEGVWLDLKALKECPFSAGHRRILQEVIRSASLAI